MGLAVLKLALASTTNVLSWDSRNSRTLRVREFRVSRWVGSRGQVDGELADSDVPSDLNDSTSAVSIDEVMQPIEANGTSSSS